MDKVLEYLNNKSIDRYGGYGRGAPIFGEDGGGAYSYSFLYMPLIRLAIDRYNNQNEGNLIILPTSAGDAVSDVEMRLFNDHFNNTINKLVGLMKTNTNLRSMLANAESWNNPEHLQDHLQEAEGMQKTISETLEVSIFMGEYYKMIQQNRLAAARPAPSLRDLPSGWTRHWNKEAERYYYHSAVLVKSIWVESDCLPGGMIRENSRSTSSTRQPVGARAAASGGVSAGEVANEGFSAADMQRAIAASMKKQGGRKTRRYKRNGKGKSIKGKGKTKKEKLRSNN